MSYSKTIKNGRFTWKTLSQCNLGIYGHVNSFPSLVTELVIASLMVYHNSYVLDYDYDY